MGYEDFSPRETSPSDDWASRWAELNRPIKEGERPKAEHKEKLGFSDAMAEAFGTWGDAGELLPYAGIGFELNEVRQIWAAADAVQEGTVTPEQEKLLYDLAQHEEAEKGIGYVAGTVIAHAPGFAIEFITGGTLVKGALKGAGRVAAGKGLKEAVKAAMATMAQRGARRAIQKTFTRKAVEAPAKAAAILSVNEGIGQLGSKLITGEGGGRIDVSAYRRVLANAGIEATENEAGDIAVALAGSLEDYTDAMPEAVMDLYIEYLSEMTGGAFGHLKRLPVLDRLTFGQVGVLRWLKRKTGLKGTGLIQELFDRGGWHGVLPEWGEERIGGFLRATLGSTVGMAEAGDSINLDNVIKQTFADWDVNQLAGELLGFGVIGGGRALGQIATTPAGERKQYREDALVADRFAERMGREISSPEELTLFRELEKSEERKRSLGVGESESRQDFLDKEGAEMYDVPEVDPEGANEEEVAQNTRLREIQSQAREEYGAEASFFRSADGSPSTSTGVYLGEGQILLAHDLEDGHTYDSVRAVMLHETLHHAASEMSEDFERLRGALVDMGYGERLDDISRRYQGKLWTETRKAGGAMLLPKKLQNEEAIANIANVNAVLFAIQEAGGLEALSGILGRDRTLWERVMDFFTHMANKLGFQWADSRQREAVNRFREKGFDLADRRFAGGQRVGPVTQADIDATRAVSTFLSDIQNNLQVASLQREVTRAAGREADRVDTLRQEEGAGALGMQAPRAIRSEAAEAAEETLRTGPERLRALEDMERLEAAGPTPTGQFTEQELAAIQNLEGVDPSIPVEDLSLADIQREAGLYGIAKGPVYPGEEVSKARAGEPYLTKKDTRDFDREKYAAREKAGYPVLGAAKMLRREMQEAEALLKREGEEVEGRTVREWAEAQEKYGTPSPAAIGRDEAMRAIRDAESGKPYLREAAGSMGGNRSLYFAPGANHFENGLRPISTHLRSRLLRSIRMANPETVDEVGLSSAVPQILRGEIEKRFGGATELSVANIQRALKDVAPEELYWADLNELIAGREKVPIEELYEWALESQLFIYTDVFTTGSPRGTYSYGYDTGLTPDDVREKWVERTVVKRIEDAEYQRRHLGYNDRWIEILDEEADIEIRQGKGDLWEVFVRWEMDLATRTQQEWIAITEEADRERDRATLYDEDPAIYGLGEGVTEVRPGVFRTVEAAVQRGREVGQEFINEAITEDAENMDLEELVFDLGATEEMEGNDVEHYSYTPRGPHEHYEEQVFTYGNREGELAEDVYAAHTWSPASRETKIPRQLIFAIVDQRKYTLGDHLGVFLFIEEIQSDHHSRRRKTFYSKVGRNLHALLMENQDVPFTTRDTEDYEVHTLADGATPEQAERFVELHKQAIEAAEAEMPKLGQEKAFRTEEENKARDGMLVGLAGALEFLESQGDYAAVLRALSDENGAPFLTVNTIVTRDSVREALLALTDGKHETFVRPTNDPDESPSEAAFEVARQMVKSGRLGAEGKVIDAAVVPVLKDARMQVRRGLVQEKDEKVNEWNEVKVPSYARIGEAINHVQNYLTRALAKIKESEGNEYAGARPMEIALDQLADAATSITGMVTVRTASREMGAIEKLGWNNLAGKIRRLVSQHTPDAAQRAAGQTDAEDVYAGMDLASKMTALRQLQDMTVRASETFERLSAGATAQARPLEEEWKRLEKLVSRASGYAAPITSEEGLASVAQAEASARMSGPREAPFGDNRWVGVMAKALLRQAIHRGLGGIGWNSSETLSVRWSATNRLGYENVYDFSLVAAMRKIVEPFGVEVQMLAPEGHTVTWGVEFNDAIKEYFLSDMGYMGRFQTKFNEPLLAELRTKHGLKPVTKKAKKARVKTAALEYERGVEEAATPVGVRPFGRPSGITKERSYEGQAAIIAAGIRAEFTSLVRQGVRTGNATDYLRWLNEHPAAKKAGSPIASQGQLEYEAWHDVKADVEKRMERREPPQHSDFFNVGPRSVRSMSVSEDGALQTDFSDEDAGWASWGVRAADGGMQGYGYILYNTAAMSVLPDTPEAATALPDDTPTYMAGFGSLDETGAMASISADVMAERAPAAPVSVIRQVVEATKAAIREKMEKAQGPVRFYFGAYRPELDRFYGSPIFLRQLQRDFPHTTLRREEMFFSHLGDTYPTYFADIHPTSESLERHGAPAGEERAPAPRSVMGAEVGPAMEEEPAEERAFSGADEPLRSLRSVTGVEGVKESPDTATQGTVRKWLRRNLTSQGDLPKTAFEAKMDRDSALRSLELEASFLSKDFARAVKEEYGEPTPEQLATIDAAMKTKGGWRSMPVALQAPVRAMRDHLDALSRNLMASGAVQDSLIPTIEENLGAYLTRSYQAFDDPKWKDKVDPEIVNRAVSFLRDGYKNAGSPRSEAELQGLIRSMLDKADSPLNLIASGKLGSKDLSVLNKRKDIAPEIRALWGEYTDPMVNYTRSVAKMANILANQTFLNEVRQAGAAGGWFADRPLVNDFGELTRRIAAEGTSSMAPLNGLYTTPEIEQAFTDAMEAEAVPDWLRTYMKVNGAVKFSKTVGSYMTHVRNLVGNTGFMVANGHWRLAHAPGAIKATLGKLLTTSDAETREYLLKLTRAGVIGQSARANELKDVINDAIENGFTSAYDKGIAKRAKAMLKGLTEFYSAEDDVWKIFAYENEVSRYKAAGFTQEEAEEKAASIVVNTYPTYSMVPAAIKKLRRFPLVGTFVSFPAEVMRTGWNTLNLAREELSDPRTRGIGAQRLAGLSLAAVGPAAAGLATMAMFGVGDDDDEDIRRFLPEWQKNAQLLWLGKDENGSPRFVDASYTDPYSYLKKPIKALIQGESVDDAIIEAFSEIVEPFLGEEILAGKLVDVRRNRTESGRPVYNPQSATDDKVAAIMEHLWSGFEPGTLTSARRIWKAHTGHVEPWGRGYDTLDEVLAVSTGQRRQTLEVAQSLSFTVRRFNEEYRHGTQIITSKLKNQGTVPADDIVDAYEGATRVHRSAFDEMRKDAMAAMRLGVRRGQVLSVMRQAGMSKDMSVRVLHDRFFPWKPATSTVKNILGSARTREKRTEFSRRIIQVRKLRASILKELRDAQQAQ